MNRLVTVIIPNYNNIRGLQYLLSYFKEKPYKVIVVDNSKKNLGFAGGVNKGAEDAKTKWMLILNDDIEFENQRSKIKNQNDKLKIKNTEKPIEKLIEFAEERKLDAVSPILRNPDGKFENFGYKILPIGKIVLNTKYEILDTNIDGLTAACLLVKTEVFKKLGGFDEKFFAYLEDVDFFIRLKALVPPKAGDKKQLSFGIAYNTEVLHNHMTTAKTMGNFKARQDMINWWRLYFKHPEKFRFNLGFIVERLRNVSGYLKATLNF